MHGLVLAVITILVALALKQQDPFKTHYLITVVFLADVIIYIASIVLSIMLKVGFAQEVTIYASILLGFLAALLLILIMVRVLGLVLLGLLGVAVFLLIAYILLSCWHRELPQQNIAIQVKSSYEY